MGLRRAMQGDDAMGIFLNRPSVSKVCPAWRSVFTFIPTVELGRDH
jgi:hypothetical protein